MCVRLLVVSFVLNFSFCASAQKATFQYYSTSDGLSNHRAWNIVQDHNGFLWLSADALNRFDGRSFLNYTNRRDSIFQIRTESGIIHSIDDELLFMKGSRLLAASTSTGNLFDKPLDNFLSKSSRVVENQIKRINYNSLIIPILDTTTSIVSLIKYHQGVLKKTGELEDVHLIKAPIITYLNEHQESPFYCMDKSLEYLIEVDEQGKILRKIKLAHSGPILIEPRLGPSTVILQDGKVYFAEAADLIFTSHPINRHLENLPSFVCNSILQTESRNLWLAGQGRQLIYYESSKDQFFDFSEELKELIPHELDLLDLSVDFTGVLWVSTSTGLIKGNSQHSWFDTYFTGHQDVCGGLCSFRGFAEDDESAIYASFYSNAFKIDRKANTTSGPIYPVGKTPFDLLFHEGNIITNDGHVFDLNAGNFKNTYNIILDAYDDGKFAYSAKKGIWWVFKNTLYYLNDTKQSTQWEEVLVLPKSKFFTDIKFDLAGDQLWFSSGNKLQCYTVDEGKIQLVREKEWSSNTFIRFVHHDVGGHIWLATENGLLVYDVLNDRSQKFTEDDGLPNHFIVTILPEGDSCLWLGTNSGLSRLSKSSGTFINFFERDGIACNELNRRSAFAAKDSQLFFGGVGGVTAFYPEEVMSHYRNQSKNSDIALLSFTKTDTKNDTTITKVFFDKQPSVDIYYNNKSFQFEFALLDYSNDYDVKFSYLLDGYETHWSKPTSDNVASFNYLPSGDYTFRVKALNARGQWQKNELNIRVNVHPPWFYSTTGYVIYFLLLLFIGVMIFHYLKKRWELQSRLKMEHAEAKRLKELDQFKSQLYTNLTHEFRTPLTVIMGTAEQSKIEIEKQFRQPSSSIETVSELLQSSFNLIERNSRDLLRLINQLLDLSKLENNSLQLTLTQSDIIPFLRYVTESFQSYANNKNVMIRFFSASKSLIMDFDQEQCRILMVNLISNALKFTPSGGEVVVEVSHIQSESEFLNISITDNGIGIAQDHLPHIFDRFYQVNSSTTREQEGSGIGLAHTYELVKLMHGSVDVQSAVGEGTVFDIRLPVKRRADIVQPRQLHPSVVDVGDKINVDAETATAIDSSANQHLLSLLIIEDNADIVSYLKSCLKDIYSLDVALNGQIGVDKALQNLPDLILSDVMMPEKDGFEVCDILKHDDRTSHIPIILLTAKADVTSKIDGLRRGADAYLIKPFNKEELLVRLEQLAELRNRLRLRFATKVLHSQPLSLSPDDEFQVEDIFVQKVINIIDAHYADENFGLVDLCQKINMSRSQLFRKMKALTDRSPSEFIRRYRLDKAADLLKSGEWTVSEVAWKVGFKHLSHFSKNYQETFGHTPSSVIK